VTTLSRLAATLALAASVGSAAAQPVYRCGNEYTRVPCPGGRSVETPDGPSARDRARAEQALSAQKREAASLAAERERREASPRPAPVNLGPAVPAGGSASSTANLEPPRKAKGKIRVVGPEDFTVRTAPAKPRKPKAAAAPAP